MKASELNMIATIDQIQYNTTFVMNAIYICYHHPRGQ
jgi:hypothetical protein